MQSKLMPFVAAAVLSASLMAGVAPASAADAMVDGPAGKLPLNDGAGIVGCDIYNGGVSRWAQHDIPNLTACLKAYAPKVKLITSGSQR
ncbi:hypothetical protein [Acidisoma sp. L85]|uniref:hypothetical protein n=1 Tax=Acidisoma sp. L85 TaxID=1641850 RepID=UPI00131E52F1|nr:hypothetical protein [Acidisoma sp. L85]